ncbi:hypothetical protein [Pseudoalteromonas phage J2-1_QLiu-2017]|nr:hypothetical protein [Pseudoalteromonas phage J2-1_QLiu-2017]
MTEFFLVGIIGYIGVVFLTAVIDAYQKTQEGKLGFHTELVTMLKEAQVPLVVKLKAEGKNDSFIFGALLAPVFVTLILGLAFSLIHNAAGALVFVLALVHYLNVGVQQVHITYLKQRNSK